MKRNYGLDLLRIFLCLCVITTHCKYLFPIKNGQLASIFDVFIFQADAVFFVLSGYFNLNKEFNNKKDIIKFYKSRIITALIPFVAFIVVWTTYDYVNLNDSFNIFELLETIFISIVDTSALGHMWFLYTLFGLLLSTPFLSKMLHNMDEKELTLLWYIGLGWNIVSIYLCGDLGYNFRFAAWMLDDWVLYYFAGYYYRHVVANQSKTKWTLIGILSFVLTCVGVLYLPTFGGATSSSAIFTLFCMACMMFWDKTFSFKNEKVQKIITFISKNTYLIYLYHMRGIGVVFGKFVDTNISFGIGMLLVFVTFLVSLLAAFITNLCLKPVQKLIDKAWVIK